jgi:hypothetical protein
MKSWLASGQGDRLEAADRQNRRRFADKRLEFEYHAVRLRLRFRSITAATAPSTSQEQYLPPFELWFGMQNNVNSS